MNSTSIRILTLLLLSCFALNNGAALPVDGGPQGLDFEGVKVSDKKVVLRWFQGKKEDNPHYTVDIVSTGAYSGNACALIQSTGKPDPWEFGSFAQYIDATPFRGKTIRFKAAVRVESQDGAEGSIWMRIDRTGENRSSHVQTEQPITSSEWKVYEVKEAINNDAEYIYIGCLLNGQGKMFFDAGQFEILTGKDALAVRDLSKPANMDFENPDIHGKRRGWFTPSKKYVPSYDVKLISQGAYSGKQYLAIYSTGKPGEKEFGNIMQAVDATPYRGKTVRFRGAVRMGSLGHDGRAQMWMRVDRPNRQMGFFDNMHDRPVTATEWKEYDITGTVDMDATDIYIGCMLIGEGKADFDAVSFEIIDEHPPITSTDPMRSGWGRAGSSPRNYTMGTNDDPATGEYMHFIKYKSSEQSTGFGTYMKMHDPGIWAGKKLRMTGFIKTTNVNDWCGMWCRVDGDPEKRETLDFDNMQDRPIKGTTNWKKYEIIINVPKKASAIAYGVLVDGEGEAYFRNINFEVLGDAAN